jgi:hypothetical protein
MTACSRQLKVNNCMTACSRQHMTACSRHSVQAVNSQESVRLWLGCEGNWAHRAAHEQYILLHEQRNLQHHNVIGLQANRIEQLVVNAFQDTGRASIYMVKL